MSTTRRIAALLAYSPTTGAATTCVGVIGIDGDPESPTVITRLFLGPVQDQEAGGWSERLEQTGPDGPSGADLDRWVREANGIVWDIAEIDPGEIDTDEDLDLAVDGVLDDITVNPDPVAGSVLAANAPAGD